MQVSPAYTRVFSSGSMHLKKRIFFSSIFFNRLESAGQIGLVLTQVEWAVVE
jgi:hypothetical protein